MHHRHDVVPVTSNRHLPDPKPDPNANLNPTPLWPKGRQAHLSTRHRDDRGRANQGHPCRGSRVCLPMPMANFASPRLESNPDRPMANFAFPRLGSPQISPGDASSCWEHTSIHRQNARKLQKSRQRLEPRCRRLTLSYLAAPVRIFANDVAEFPGVARGSRPDRCDPT